MPRTTDRKRFFFGPPVRSWIHDRLVVQFGRRRGDVKSWYAELQADHPDWVPKTSTQGDYNDFLQVIVKIEEQLKAEAARPPVPSPAPPVEAEAASGGTHPVEEDDLAAMGRTAHALIDLAVKRHERETIQFALEALAHLLQSPKAKP